MRVWVRVSFIRLFQATYDDRFEQDLICSSSGKFRIYTASNQFSYQVESYGSQIDKPTAFQCRERIEEAAMIGFVLA